MTYLGSSRGGVRRTSVLSRVGFKTYDRGVINMVQITNSVRVKQHSTPECRIPFTRTQICEEARAAVQQILGSGRVTSGQQVIEFEREFAEYVGSRHAIAVSACTAALELALRALQLPAGSRVRSEERR